MANFPTSLDSFPTILPSDTLDTAGKELDVMINSLSSSIVAIEAQVGISGSAVAGTVEKRISTLQADVVSAQTTANNALPNTMTSAWGTRSNPITNKPLIPPGDAARSNCYFWAWPASNATTRYGEHHIYAPVGTSNYYYGVILGVRGKASYAVPFDCVHGLFKPGLYTLAASCSRAGSWSSNTNAGAMLVTYYYSVAAGATISASLSGTILAAHIYMYTNGGYAIVSVDGSYTFTSPLPIFTSQDFSDGLCRASDVGKHYISSYFSTSWCQAVVVAEGLSDSSHTLTLEITGTKPIAASDCRVYVEALIGCSATDSCSNANTYMVPVRRFCEMATANGSAYYTVVSFAPSASSDYQFLTSVHADNTNCKEVSVSGPTVLVDGTDRSAPTLGTYYYGSLITWYQESTASHKANLATQVLNRKRRFSAMANRQCPIMVELTLQWLVDGTINKSYPLMLPLNAYNFMTRTTPVEAPSKISLGNTSLTASGFSADDDSLVLYGTQDFIVESAPSVLTGQYSDCMTWGVLYYESPSLGQAYSAKGRYVLQDRADKLDKLYVSDVYNSPIAVLTNEIHRYVVGYGGLMASEYPA